MLMSSQIKYVSLVLGVTEASQKQHFSKKAAPSLLLWVMGGGGGVENACRNTLLLVSNKEIHSALAEFARLFSEI